MKNNNNYCVILAGGIGTRLWPSSRQQRPKQFLDFFNNGETLLQMTYKRYLRFIDRENILVISNHQYEDLVREQLPTLPDGNLLLEPMRRDTVPSVAWAAVEIARRNPEACMVVTPADQVITKGAAFEEDILLGLDYVRRHARLLTLGIVPTRPETAYGYIQMADKMEQDIYRVQSFTEKPEQEFARLFVENKEFLWNTGLFIWGVRTFVSTMREQFDLFETMMEDAETCLERGTAIGKLVENAFAVCPNVSLEQGVLEKMDNVDVMLCHFGWSDIGTWDALYDVLPKTSGNNVVMSSRAMLYDCKDCIVKLPSGKIAVVQGLEDYVVADEGNILVICRKDDQGAIRKFVNDVQLTAGDEFV